MTERSKIKPYPRFCLRLFVSVDIVGSTAHKQSESAHFADWFQPFADLYAHFPQELNRTWAEQAASDDHVLGSVADGPPEFWKSIGDEILFYREICHPFDAGYMLDCFRLVAMKLRPELRARNPRNMLDFKMTAWLAGFPVNNVEVVTGPEPSWLEPYDTNYMRSFVRRKYFPDRRPLWAPLPPNDYPEIDRGNLEFIGPQIDLGFRLAKYASPKHFVVSADLAYLLSKPGGAYGLIKQGEALGAIASRCIRFKEWGEMRGILGGSRYPILYLDSSEPEGLHPEPEPLAADKIVKFCERHFSTDSPLPLPFIAGCGKSDFGTIPESHRQKFESFSFTLQQFEETFHLRSIQNKGEEGTQDVNVAVDEFLSSVTPN